MPTFQREIPLDATSQAALNKQDGATVLETGDVLLTVLINFCTAGQPYLIRFGRNGTWLGPYTGYGDWIIPWILGALLPLSDRNQGVYIRTDNPTPGARIVVAGSTAGASSAG